MKKILSLSFLIIIMNLCIYSAVSSAQNEALCNKFLRVHVVANSNSSYDQGVKLAVRDYIFNIHKSQFASFKTKDDAINFVTDNISTLETEINEYLKYLNCNYNAEIKITKEKFPKKSYDEITLPEGTYNAFKVILGNGKGKNFFCVMFPPMCIDSGITTDITLNDITTKKEKDILLNEITYKFKLLDLIK